MAFKPTNNYVSFRLPVLDGGLNTKFTDTSTPLNSSPDLSNILLDDFGAVRSTPGYVKFNATAIASAPIDGMGTYYDPSGDRIIMCACNGNYYQQVGNSFTVLSGSTSVYTAGVHVKMINVGDKVLFGDGYAAPYKWDGTYFLKYGAAQPAGVAAATPVSTASGVLSGTYNYAITYVNSALAESNFQVIATGVVLPWVPFWVDLSAIPTAPASWGINSINIYRTTAAASSTYWLVTSVSGAQTSVTDNNADADLVTTMPVDRGAPPQCKFMVYYRGRIFAAGDPQNPYRVYYSESALGSGGTEAWPVLNFLEIEKGDGFLISGLEAWGNSIVIHKNDGKGNGSIYLLYIADAASVSDTTNWYVFKSPAAYSAISDKSQAFFQNLLFYVNRTGAYALSGQDLARSTADSEYGRFSTDSLSYTIDTDVKLWTASQLSNAAAITFDNKVWLAVPLASTNNNTIYVYDFVRLGEDKKGVWSKLSAPAVSNFVVNDGALYAGGYNGIVYKMQSGSSFDGAAISPYYYTAYIGGAPEHRDNVKVFRFLYIVHECSGNWNLNIDYLVDFDGIVGSKTLNLTSGGSIWGTLQWSNGAWGGGVTTKRSRLIIPGAVGKAIKFKFSVTGLNESFKIKELELVYNLRGKRG
jgi:hypothetical protein